MKQPQTYHPEARRFQKRQAAAARARREKLVEAITAGGHLQISLSEAGEWDYCRVIMEGVSDAILYDNEPTNLAARHRALDLVIDAAKCWRAY